MVNRNLPNLLHDVRDKGLIELVNDASKIKQTQKRKLVEEILAELTSQCASFSESEALVIPEIQKSPELLFLLKSLSSSRTTICSTTSSLENSKACRR